MGQGSGGGPKSSEGKALVARNPLKYALTSPSPVVTEIEDEGEWEAFVGEIVSALAPVAALEIELAERAASLLWRLRGAGGGDRRD